MENPLPPRLAEDRAGQWGKWLALLFLAALLFRLLNLWLMSENAYLLKPRGDALYNLQWARELAITGFSPGTAYHQAPLYPHILGVALRFLPHPLWTMRLLQVLLGSLVPLLLALAAYRVCRHRFAAIFIGVLAAFYGPFAFYDSLLLKESVGVFLLSLFLFLAVRDLDRPTLWGCFSSGLVLGIFWMVRENAPLLSLPVLGFHLLAGGFRRPTLGRRILLSGLFALGTVVFTGANVASSLWGNGEFARPVVMSGVNFYLGNHPDSDGFYRPMEFQTGNVMSEVEEFQREAARKFGETMDPGRTGLYFWSKSLSFIRTQPLRWLWLQAKKFLIFWNAYEIPDNYDIRFTSHFLPYLGYAPGFTLVAVLGLLGLALGEQNSHRLLFAALIGIYSVSVALFFVYARYRLFVVPMLLISSSLAVREFLGRLEQGQWKKLWRGFSLAALLLALPLNPVCAGEARRISSFSWAAYGGYLYDTGRKQEARGAVNRSLSFSQKNVWAHFYLGELDFEARRFRQAAEHYLKGFPQSVDSDYFFRKAAGALMAAGDRVEAMELLRRWEKLEPENPEPARLLAGLLGKEGRGRPAGSAPLKTQK